MSGEPEAGGVGTRNMYDFLKEPQGDVLRRLLLFLTPHAERLLMVLRSEEKVGPVGQDLLAKLQPHLHTTTLGSRWPGTWCPDGGVTIFEFTLRPGMCELLLSTCDRLYSWLQPELPEDLALMRSDGTEILGSTGHEHDAWLMMTDEEFAELVKAVPEVGEMAVDARVNPERLNPPDWMNEEDDLDYEVTPYEVPSREKGT